MGMQPFPTDWDTALVLVPHPDDPEYGMAAAVAKWTAAGKDVRYVLASRGEAGIAGMAPEVAGPIREDEQRRSAAVVGVHDVQFWDFPDSRIVDTAELRTAITEAITTVAPQLVITIYSGREFGPDMPNQRDHIEFATAVAAVFDELTDPPRWLFEYGPDPTHAEVVDGYIEPAVEALATHQTYLSVLDPQTPVIEQARQVVDRATAPDPALGDQRTVGFILRRDSRVTAR